MTRPSNREAVFAAFDRRDSRAKISTDLGISKQAVSEWARKWERERSTVNASIDQSTSQSHRANGNPTVTNELSHRTSPEPLERTGAKDRRDSRDAAGRFVEDRLTKSQKVAVMIETLELGTSRTAAYAISGIPASTAALWFETDESFRAAVLEAESRVETKVANALFLYATSGKVGSHIAAAIYLERAPHTGNRWRRRDHVSVEGQILHTLVDPRKIVASPAAIIAAGRLETALQRAEEDQRDQRVIEGQAREVSLLPAFNSDSSEV